MIKALKKKYALSNQGAKDLLKGIVYSVLANISLMFPVILLAIVLNQLLAPVLGTSAPEISAAVYTVIGIVILAVVFIFHYCQYTAAYLGTYDESARRRIGLAEKLRTLPLTFFHQRDLADLTSTIMGDCANFEHAFSHTVPQFFGAVISTGIVCIGLLIFNWQMGLALLWVAPISFTIVILSRKWQEKLNQKHMNARLELAEGIQECLETVQDIKACNQEEDYLRKLDAKMDAAEKAQISSEMTTASLLTTGQMFLRLGLATVIVVGNGLVVSGGTSLFTYILFLIAASRLYDPLSGAMSNMAELFSVQLQVNRLKEIEEYPEETGEKNIHTNGYDIMSLHLGLHWSGIMNTVRRRLHIQDASRNRVLLLRLLAAVFVGYGLYAFAHYRFSDYLLLRTHFIFFAPDQTATRFVVDHLAVMGLFACVAHYGGMGLRCFSGRKKEK